MYYEFVLDRFPSPRNSRNFALFASASAVNVDAISAILNFQLVPSLISTDGNPRNVSFSIFEPSVAKYLLALIIS